MPRWDHDRLLSVSSMDTTIPTRCQFTSTRAQSNKVWVSFEPGNLLRWNMHRASNGGSRFPSAVRETDLSSHPRHCLHQPRCASKWPTGLGKRRRRQPLLRPVGRCRRSPSPEARGRRLRRRAAGGRSPRGRRQATRRHPSGSIRIVEASGGVESRGTLVRGWARLHRVRERQSRPEPDGVVDPSFVDQPLDVAAVQPEADRVPLESKFHAASLGGMGQGVGRNDPARVGVDVEARIADEAEQPADLQRFLHREFVGRGARRVTRSLAPPRRLRRPSCGRSSS